MASSYYCSECLHHQDSAQRCAECNADRLIDSNSDSELGDFVAELTKRATGRRRKFLFAMEAMAILLCAGVLFVGVTLASGLESTALSMAAKAAAVVLLAAAWVAIPRIYDDHLSGPAAALVSSLDRQLELD